jgi:c-di-GMP-binding flagellar brake protein YcgR
LSEQEYIEATGRIERLESLGTKELCQTAIVFVMIYENDRDRIIAYVFEREIELRRKGLL